MTITLIGIAFQASLESVKVDGEGSLGDLFLRAMRVGDSTHCSNRSTPTDSPAKPS